ncbi:hypothetical protein L218DRAFT_1072931 [Marasmius fiardii PR-910]|nr:hypothetical protein L218DRAFT_1072931 [Marasmius fiardii PR-910]
MERRRAAPLGPRTSTPLGPRTLNRQSSLSSRKRISANSSNRGSVDLGSVDEERGNSRIEDDGEVTQRISVASNGSQPNIHRGSTELLSRRSNQSLSSARGSADFGSIREDGSVVSPTSHRSSVSSASPHNIRNEDEVESRGVEGIRMSGSEFSSYSAQRSPSPAFAERRRVSSTPLHSNRVSAAPSPSSSPSPALGPTLTYPTLPSFTSPPELPPHFKALPYDAAVWTLTSSELQEMVSRSIRCSARESFVRLLSLRLLDTELPDELEKLSERKVEKGAKYRFLVQRKSMLVRGLWSIAGSDLTVTSMLSQLSEASAECDKLAGDLVKICDQIKEIQQLMDNHSASTLAVALRKLNSSYAKRTDELVRARERISQLEGEKEDAWKEAERLASRLDELEREQEREREQHLEEVERETAWEEEIAEGESAILMEEAQIVHVALPQPITTSPIPVRQTRLSTSTFGAPNMNSPKWPPSSGSDPQTPQSRTTPTTPTTPRTATPQTSGSTPPPLPTIPTQPRSEEYQPLFQPTPVDADAGSDNDSLSGEEILIQTAEVVTVASPTRSSFSLRPMSPVLEKPTLITIPSSPILKTSTSLPMMSMITSTQPQLAQAKLHNITPLQRHSSSSPLASSPLSQESPRPTPEGPLSVSGHGDDEWDVDEEEHLAEIQQRQPIESTPELVSKAMDTPLHPVDKMGPFRISLTSRNKEGLTIVPPPPSSSQPSPATLSPARRPQRLSNPQPPPFPPPKQPLPLKPSQLEFPVPPQSPGRSSFAPVKKRSKHYSSSSAGGEKTPTTPTYLEGVSAARKRSIRASQGSLRMASPRDMGDVPELPPKPYIQNSSEPTSLPYATSQSYATKSSPSAQQPKNRIHIQPNRHLAMDDLIITPSPMSRDGHEQQREKATRRGSVDEVSLVANMARRQNPEFQDQVPPLPNNDSITYYSFPNGSSKPGKSIPSVWGVGGAERRPSVRYSAASTSGVANEGRSGNGGTGGGLGAGIQKWKRLMNQGRERFSVLG